jgi:L-asparaginase/Glu-tRNA(Gln) amidotransferase subunit D
MSPIAILTTGGTIAISRQAAGRGAVPTLGGDESLRLMVQEERREIGA